MRGGRGCERRTTLTLFPLSRARERGDTALHVALWVTSRGEGAKYNRLLRIEEELGAAARYAGREGLRRG